MLGVALLSGLMASHSPVRASEPARSESLAYATGVQTYISHFPLMDLYRTLWETSFDPKRGHDRTLNEFFVFDRLINSSDDWVISPNNDTIYLRGFLDLRKEPMILVIPPMGDRQYWVPVSDMHHDFDANLSWDTIGARGGAFAFVAPGWQGVLPEGVRRIDMGTPIAWLLPRIPVDGDADLPAAVALQKQFRLFPLSQWGVKEVARPKPDPADFPRFTRAELTDAKAYFTALNSALRLTPRIGNPMDAAMAGWLRELGMEPGSKFDWDKLSAETRRGLERATADAHKIIAERMQRSVPIENNWQLARLPKRKSGEPRDARSALESRRGQHLRHRLPGRLRRTARRAQALRAALQSATAGRWFLVGDDVCGQEPALRPQSHQPLFRRRSHEGPRPWRGRFAHDLPPA
jgi:hypothetical protein